MAGLMALVCLLWLLADDLGLSAGAVLRTVYARERAVEKWRSDDTRKR